jgi:preprotein translocase subunit SecA
MSSAALPRLLPEGAYPERPDGREGWLDRVAAAASRPARRWQAGHRRRWADLVGAVAEHGRALDALGDAGLRDTAAALASSLRGRGLAQDLVARAFALVREAAGRTLGLRHHDVQLIGGKVLLDGRVAEMETGEGKTLTATLAASAAALAGLPVHVVTVNDYLAARDAEAMGPVYRALGLSVGLVVHGVAPAARRAAYACDVTYCTNKELVFDYLRDRLVLHRRPNRVQLQLERLAGDQTGARRLVLRGLVFAIVDEADSVLIDEARTPLVISGTTGIAAERRVYEQALALAAALVRDRDFTLDGAERAIALTEAGRHRLAGNAGPLGGLWAGRLRREDLVRQALTAQHLMARDRHYLVRDGRVQIVDEFTGRLMPDRSWERGLHQLVEVKEGVTLTLRTQPLARISHQRFFRRYLRLAGMTGTAREVRGELAAVYRLLVVRVPTHRPVVRRGLPDRILPTAEAKWAAVVDRIARVYQAGRPVLVGTRSVAASEHLSGLLAARGLPHEVLNARQDRREAEIVARAGEGGRITVATNMAGRGTDIRLGPGVRARGGLHVIATERHEAGRIDRQLFGRCGRQGDPGTHEAVLSLVDEVVVVHGHRVLVRFTSWLLTAGLPGATALAAWHVRRAQRRAERRCSRERRDLLRHETDLEAALAFAGRGE